MTVIFHESVVNEQTTNSTTWVEMASKQGNLDTGMHMLWLSFEYGGDATNREVEVQVTVNGAQRRYDYHTPSKSGGFKGYGTFGIIDVLADATSYTIAVNMQVENAAQTGRIRNIELTVMKE
jgi:hypothetical protein